MTGYSVTMPPLNITGTKPHQQSWRVIAKWQPVLMLESTTSTMNNLSNNPLLYWLPPLVCSVHPIIDRGGDADPDVALTVELHNM